MFCVVVCLSCCDNDLFGFWFSCYVCFCWVDDCVTVFGLDWVLVVVYVCSVDFVSGDCYTLG